MRVFLYSLALICFVSCDLVQNPVVSGVEEETTSRPIDDDAYQKDTFDINDQQLIQIRKGNKFFCMKFFHEDTIIKFADHYSNVAIYDIDHDGFKDLQVNVVSNNPNECQNYFFNERYKTYVLIRNSFLPLEKLQGCNYYISDERGGCAGDRWVGYLSQIKDYVLTDIGFIDANNCEASEAGISIYKVKNGVQTLYKKLPIRTLKKFKGSATAFIANFWSNNFNQFEK